MPGTSAGDGTDASDHKGAVKNQCAVCDKAPVTLRCSRCRVVYYCSREHQKQHWKSHKKSCNADRQAVAQAQPQPQAQPKSAPTWPASGSATAGDTYMLDIEGAGPSLGQHVVIGCCDVDCAGARALLSTQMTPPAAGSWKKVVQTVTCRDLGDAVCTSTEQKAAPLSIVHFTAPGARQANVSLIIINTVFTSQTAKTLVPHQLVEMLNEADVESVAVLCALNCNGPAVQAHTYGTAPSESKGLPALDSKAEVKDPVLVALLHFLEMSGLPTTVVATPSTRRTTKSEAQAARNLARWFQQANLPLALNETRLESLAANKPSPHPDRAFYV